MINRLIGKKKQIALIALALVILCLLGFYITHRDTSTKSVDFSDKSVQDLFSVSNAKQRSAWKALLELNKQQKQTLKSQIMDVIEQKLSQQQGTFENFAYYNQLLAQLETVFPNDPRAAYLIQKNRFNQTNYLADRILSYNQLFNNWPNLSQAQIKEALLIRAQITALLPDAPLTHDARLDFALLVASEKALMANQKAQSAVLMQQVAHDFPQADYRHDLQDRIANQAHWSNKHHPPILSDEWVEGLEHSAPSVAIWLQNLPMTRQLQEQIAAYYLQQAEKRKAEHRYFLALSTLEKARYFASNLPSVELSYELEKKRYDLFLAERAMTESDIKQAGLEKIFETLLAVGAIAQAETILTEESHFLESFIQTKAPVLIKAAYANLAAFTQLQDKIEGNETTYYATYDLSASHALPQSDLLLADEVVAAPQVQPQPRVSYSTTKNRMTYLKSAQVTSLIKIPPKLSKELLAGTNVEPFLYGTDSISQLTQLPVFIAEKKQDATPPKPVTVAQTGHFKKDLPPLPPLSTQKTPADRLAGKLVETALKYSGNDKCAKAWFSAKKTTVACNDTIAGSQRPLTLLVVPLNNDSQHLYAISENPVSIGDYNRYCLLSNECKPLNDKPEVKKAKHLKIKHDDDDLPEAGLDLSDVQETIEEYDEFCIISGTCTGTLEEQNNRPVTTLSKQQIENYLKWLSKNTQHTYRLPSVEERLYALKVHPNIKLVHDGQSSQSGFHVVREVY